MVLCWSWVSYGAGFGSYGVGTGYLIVLLFDTLWCCVRRYLLVPDTARETMVMTPSVNQKQFN